MAMVIGNAGYAGLPPLRTPVADAELVAGALRSAGFEVTSLRDVASDGFAEAVDAFGEAVTEDTVVVLYYAGHGAQAAGRQYLVPVDATGPAEVPGVSLDAIVQRLRKAGETPVIAFFDAPRERRVAGSDREVRPLSAWAANDSAMVNSVFSFATAPGGAIWDTGQEHGAYAQALARLIPRQDLSILDMLATVRDDVSAATAGHQSSWDQSALRTNIVGWQVLGQEAAPK